MEIDFLEIVAVAILVYINREQYFEIKKIEAEITELEKEIALLQEQKEKEA